MDEVQLSDSAFQNRNIFLTPDRKVKYLTIGFIKKGYTFKRFCDLDFASPEKWQVQHANALVAYYGKHKFFSEIWERIESIFTKKYSLLSEPIIDSMVTSLDMLNIKTKIIYQSEIKYDRNAKKNDLVLLLVKASGADVYLAGEGSRNYLQIPTFEQENISVKWNRFQHPQYPQKYGNTFQPGLSCLDLLFNMGIENSCEIFWNSARIEPQYV
jgi:hypothetical protein